ncbi:MAG: DUF2934 domain-containing protein [Pseudomonadota bacterium]
MSEDLNAPSPKKPTDAHRHEQIRHLAYLRAERRGFEPGNEVDDWLEAEREVDRRGNP